jgi:hypothetical protein
MEALFTCQVCKIDKPICCAYKSEKNKDLSYTYCKVCCPWKQDHILSRIRAARGNSKDWAVQSTKDKALDLLVELKCSTLSTNEESILAILELLVDSLKRELE